MARLTLSLGSVTPGIAAWLLSQGLLSSLHDSSEPWQGMREGGI